MSAAEDRERQIADLLGITPEELAELRASLPLLRQLRTLLNAGRVDAPAAKPVRKARKPPDSAYQHVDRLRRQKGLADD